MSALLEAQALVGDAYGVCVLEPSAPAVNVEPWFADDPVARGDELRPLVSPVGAGEFRYEQVVHGNPHEREWLADNWLAFYRRLEHLSPAFASTRLALHSLAEQVVSPARANANGKIGLRYTHGGFGTPFFGADLQVRVEGIELVYTQGEYVRREAITGMAKAAAFVGVELETDAALALDVRAAEQLGELYGFAASVLEELRAAAQPALEPSRVQLWPEHFDMAVELGSEIEGYRAGYGISPGDELHPEPYAYVVPWGEAPTGELWQAHGFAGAQLDYEEILAAPDQRAHVIGFFAERLAALT